MSLFKFIFAYIASYYKRKVNKQTDRVFYVNTALAFLLAFNVLTVLSIVLLIMGVPFMGAMYPFVGGGMISVMLIVFYSSNINHEQMLNEFNALSRPKFKKLEKQAVVYLLFTIISFFITYYLYYNLRE